MRRARALLRDLVRVSHAEGAIWVAVWKRKFERAGAPEWEEMQSAGLATGWVDNKVLSLGDEIYATRFARRRRPAPAQRNRAQLRAADLGGGDALPIGRERDVRERL